jgi:adenylate cyclase
MADGPSTRLPRAELHALLRAVGVSDEDVARADSDGTLVLLAIEHLALEQEQRYDAAEVCRLTTLTEDELRHIWRSLGFPELQPGDEIFTDVDVVNMSALARLLHSGAVTPEVAYGMTRVVGSSMARVASAMIDTVSARAEQVLREGDHDATIDLDQIASETQGFLPMFPEVLVQVWRRHLQAAARRRVLRGDLDSAEVVVGFADMVGFTALAQQVTDQELALVVDQFEHLAYDVVVAGGGRVLKMIGDEVMFVVDDPFAAVEVALGLADASRDAAELSDVRVGLAYGSILEREGDAYGPTVNLASRATAIAYPGTVVVSPELRTALEDSPDYAFKGMRPRYLKHIGRVSLSVVRRAEDAPSTIRDAIDERRRVMRDAMRERLATRSDPVDED